MRPTRIIGLAVGAGIIIGSAGAAMAAGETPPSAEMQDCISHVKALLKTPATFAIDSYSETPTEIGQKVHISFDAQNEFGAPIRHEAVCSYNGDRIFYLDLSNRSGHSWRYQDLGKGLELLWSD
jgi:hypothetical protein